MIFYTSGEKFRIKNNGRVLINKTDDDLTNHLQVAGTISASPATTANQVVVKSQLDAAVGTSGVFSVNGIQNATYTLIGKILTIYLSANFTTANPANFVYNGTFTLPNGYVSADFLANRFVGTGSIFNGTSTAFTAFAYEITNTSVGFSFNGSTTVTHRGFCVISLRIN